MMLMTKDTEHITNLMKKARLTNENIIMSGPVPIPELYLDKMRHCKTLARQLFTDRVTIDLDDCDIDQAICTASQIIDSELKTKIKHIDIIQSSSGTGYHVIALLTDKIHWAAQLQYRIRFYDCQDRIRHSISNISDGLDNFDILFTDKFYKKEHRRIHPLYRLYDDGRLVKL